MRAIRMAALAATALIVSACGDNPAPSISITVSNDSIRVDPTKSVTITVTGTVNGLAQLPENMFPAPTLEIISGDGSFSQLEDRFDTPETKLDVMVSGGKITQKLFSPFSPSVTRVKARIVDAYGVEAVAEATVKFTAAVANTLNFSCRSRNIGVLANPSTEFSLACDASALDMDGNPMQSTSIRFLAEAGAIVKTEDSTGDRPDYVYYPRQGQRLVPKDVPPFPGEPNVMVDGLTRNPRDQLVTLVAFVDGDNQPTGDMFAGDPFVDLNDNKQRDADEPFFSADGSGTYSASQNLFIWKQFKVLWTGAMSQSLAIAKCEVLGGSGSTRDLTRTGSGARVTFRYTVLDDYFNVLAVNSISDQIGWSLDPAGSVYYDVGQLSTTAMTVNGLGMELDPYGNFPPTTTEASFRRNASYTVKVYNARTAEDMDGDKPYSVTGYLQRNLTIEDTGEPGLNIGDELLPPCGGILK